MVNVGSKVRVRRSKVLPLSAGVVVPVPTEFEGKTWATNGVVWVMWEDAAEPIWIPIEDLEVVQ